MPVLRMDKTSSHVAVSGSRWILHPFEIFSLDQTFDSLLDHGNVWQEPSRELVDDFCDEVGVIELFSLPSNSGVSFTTNPRKPDLQDC